MSGASSFLPVPEQTWEVTPESVAKWVQLPRDQRPRLIDCREEDELTICQIEGNEWFPLDTFPFAGERLTADDARGVVVYCHHGIRSLRATAFLRANGVEKAFSMQGGIDAWSRLIDPEVPRY
ncbi:MAG TPA: rhodanese-like domain-containing protein [Luteolibacter sp.]